VFVCLPGACWNDRCRSEREAEAETQTFSEWISNGPFDEQMRPNPAEASGSRSGVAIADRVESGGHVMGVRLNEGLTTYPDC